MATGRVARDSGTAIVTYACSYTRVGGSIAESAVVKTDEVEKIYELVDALRKAPSVQFCTNDSGREVAVVQQGRIVLLVHQDGCLRIEDGSQLKVGMSGSGAELRHMLQALLKA